MVDVLKHLGDVDVPAARVESKTVSAREAMIGGRTSILFSPKIAGFRAAFGGSPTWEGEWNEMDNLDPEYRMGVEQEWQANSGKWA